MVATPHAVVGAAIGVAVGDPVWAFVLGSVSHFLGDRAPHMEATTFYGKEPRYWRQRLAWVLADVSAMVVLMAALLWSHPHRTAGVWGMIGGLGPDLVTNIPRLGDRLASHWGFRQFRAFHHWTHYGIPRERWPLGVATQVVALTAGVACLLCTR